MSQSADWILTEEEEKKREAQRQRLKDTCRKINKEYSLKKNTEIVEEDKSVKGLDRIVNELRKKNDQKEQDLTRSKSNYEANHGKRLAKYGKYTSLQGWFGCQDILCDII